MRDQGSQLASVLIMTRTGSPPLLALSVVLALGLTGCITINVPASEQTRAPEPTKTAAVADKSYAAPSDEADDSAALGHLSGAMGALYAYIEIQSMEDCDYVAYVAGGLASSTPLSSYRGTYESVTRSMAQISELCLIDPTNETAVDLAVSTRPDVTAILDDREYLGGNWSSGERPIKGRQM
jgi:hypothetical protein